MSKNNAKFYKISSNISYIFMGFYLCIICVMSILSNRYFSFENLIALLFVLCSFIYAHVNNKFYLEEVKNENN